MIGRHPQLYSFPDLNLFIADRVDTLMALDAEACDAPLMGTYLGGAVRTIAEVYFSDQGSAALAKARAWLQAHREDTTQMLMDSLLARIHPRTGVEKSARTGMSRTSMERARGFYPDARFVHLTRHPITAIESMRNCHQPFKAHAVSAWTESSILSYCGRVWLHTQRSILRFTSTLAPGQSMRVRSESILRDPDEHLPRVLSWLGLPQWAGEVDLMKHPEFSPYARKLDGIRDDSDSSFLLQPSLRAIPDDPPLEFPTAWGVSQPLAAEVVEMAAALGYG